jgi:hypothetical protein
MTPRLGAIGSEVERRIDAVECWFGRCRLGPAALGFLLGAGVVLAGLASFVVILVVLVSTS